MNTRNFRRFNGPTQRRTLSEEDIYEGAVAYLDPAVLNARKDVVLPPSPAIDRRPFLCIEADQSRSCWIELTTQPGRDRYEIPAWARKGGDDKWRGKRNYVNDARSTYVGPHAVFIAAAVRGCFRPGDSRPGVLLEIVRQILAEVVTSGGARLDPSNPRVYPNPAA